MDPYDPALVPGPFGLYNTGAICYLNSYLQMLAGCSALARAVLGNAEYAQRTRTGAAVLEFFRAATKRGAATVDVAHLSARVLAALVADLAVRRSHVRFGGGQESASEALVHIFDMMEPPPPPGAASGAGAAPGGAHISSVESPITRLFLHRFRCELHCCKCRKVVSTETDFAVVFSLFHLDRMRTPPASVADFSKAMRHQVSETDGYRCPGCGETTKALRVYTLTMVPEILVCAFNLYVGYGGARVARYFPERVEFPAIDGGLLAFRLVGQVEHSGGMGGGHYWARGLRAGGFVYTFNDTGVSARGFAPTPDTYLLAYHFEGHTRGDAP